MHDFAVAQSEIEAHKHQNVAVVLAEIEDQDQDFLSFSLSFTCEVTFFSLTFALISTMRVCVSVFGYRDSISSIGASGYYRPFTSLIIGPVKKKRILLLRFYKLGFFFVF